MGLFLKIGWVVPRGSRTNWVAVGAAFDRGEFRQTVTAPSLFLPPSRAERVFIQSAERMTADRWRQRVRLE